MGAGVMRRVAGVMAVAGCAAAVGVVGLPRAAGQPVGTAFTYQGELRADGALGEGVFDFRFRVYDSAAGTTQVGPTVCVDDVSVVGGRFTVQLDFGGIFVGTERYLEIQVRADTGLGCADPTGLEVLSGLQRIAPTPQALYAPSAGVAANASLLNGQSSAFFQNAGNLTSGVIPSARIQGNYAQAVNFTSIGNTFAGSGAALTSLNATNISSGTISVARLPNPLVMIGSVAGDGVIFGQNTATTASSAGVRGLATQSSGLGQGVLGSALSPDGAGVRGLNTATSGTAYGVWGTTNSTVGAGVRGEADNGSGVNAGGWFRTLSGSGYGVRGQNSAASGSGVGGYFTSASPTGRALLAESLFDGSSTVAGRFVGSSTGTGIEAEGLFAGRFTSGETGTNGGSAIVAEALGTVGEPRAGEFSVVGTFARGVVVTAVTQGVNSTISGISGVAVSGLSSSTTATGGPIGGIFQVNSPTGVGVVGVHNSTTGNSAGVLGQSSSTTVNAAAVRGQSLATTGAPIGGDFTAESPNGTAVRGLVTSTTGSAWAGWFTTNSTTGRGLRVESLATTGTGTAGEFFATSPDAIAVRGRGLAGTGTAAAVEGESASASSNAVGVRGLVTPTTSGPFAAGVRGVNNGTNSNGLGVLGTHAGTGTGVRGSSSGVGVQGVTFGTSSSAGGVIGEEPSGGSGHAVWAFGSTAATGTKSFQIDHPLEPETKFLNHFSVESPEPYTIYRGTAQLDGRGAAEIELPAYFAEVNRDPTVTLTAVGAPMPGLHLATDVEGNRFAVAGGAPGMRIHWRVEATRNDRWMRAYGAAHPTEQEKDASTRGKFLNPELFGKPMDLRILPWSSKEEIAPVVTSDPEADRKPSDPAATELKTIK